MVIPLRWYSSIPGYNTISFAIDCFTGTFVANLAIADMKMCSAVVNAHVFFRLCLCGATSLSIVCPFSIVVRESRSFLSNVSFPPVQSRSGMTLDVANQNAAFQCGMDDDTRDTRALTRLKAPAHRTRRAAPRP